MPDQELVSVLSSQYWLSAIEWQTNVDLNETFHSLMGFVNIIDYVLSGNMAESIFVIWWLE